ncbi:deoxyribose-phosphate aldolase [Amnibacterium flavum]|uniref:Deoxyribose-phosphate aldolase n=1 Tax=Amnibacterium flavum TaxID=2173173 RepID=A0A2V1HPW2_9MICO|nr:deoxyribose-phosphate aldolase [Amnibacterium flavum]PVZ94361.1 deoxyribose-phosphate aldolase [Amnibacterium flavum]
MSDLTSDQLARYIDHTLLKPEATHADVEALIAEAVRLGTYSVCVSPNMLPLSIPEGSGLKVAAVCGFPSGKHLSEVKAREAALAVAAGADEIDMVIDVGAVRDGRIADVQADIQAVRDAVPAPTVLKVIIEAAALDDAEIVAACVAAVAASADFVKTSTGFHPAGGASERAVRLMAETVEGELGVKASGGIRTREDAIRMIEAGATRLGVSASAAVLGEATAAPATY